MAGYIPPGSYPYPNAIPPGASTGFPSVVPMWGAPPPLMQAPHLQGADGIIDDGSKNEVEEEGNILALHGNAVTMNFDELLFQNVRRSDYFKDLYELKTYHEVVDEIYNEVSNIDPWVATVALRKPSTAYTLLLKLFTLKVTRRQMKQLIIHKDSPYIRALGFLYLRYTCPPKDLWSWFEPFLDDEEGVLISATTTTETPMCVFMVDLLLLNRHCGTILPRIPVMISRKICEDLKKYAANNPDSAVAKSTTLRDAIENDNKSKKGNRARDELSGRKRHRVDDNLITSKDREGESSRYDTVREEVKEREEGEVDAKDDRYHRRDRYGSDSGRDREERHYRHERDRSRERHSSKEDKDTYRRDRYRERSSRHRSRSRERHGSHRTKSRSSDRRSRDRSRSRDRDRWQHKSMSPVPESPPPSIGQGESRAGPIGLQAAYGDSRAAETKPNLSRYGNSDYQTERIVLKQPAAARKYRALMREGME